MSGLSAAIQLAISHTIRRNTQILNLALGGGNWDRGTMNYTPHAMHTFVYSARAFPGTN